jgi:DNA-binding NarL/FixJ family response regulator
MVTDCQIVFLSSDLMFGSRVVGAVRALGAPLLLVSRMGELKGKLSPGCRLVMVDLGLDGLDLSEVVTVVRAAAAEARIVAYGAHVNEAALAAASQAGCDQVLTRGQFHNQYAELLKAAVTV